MSRIAYEIIKDFGALGIGVVQLGIILWGGWKLMTNHLFHIQSGIDNIKAKQNDTEEKVNHLCERVSKIEGKLE